MAQLLERIGILYRPRAGMTIELATLSERPRLPPGYEVAPWDADRLPEVGQIDYRCYENTIDRRLYHAYFATPAGCERFWREALRGRFGRFDPERSLLLLRDGQLVGQVMASARTGQEGFIGDLAVLPEHRGGTGRALLLSCLCRFQEARFQRVSLAVTLANERAYRLYLSLGFRVTAKFPMLAWANRR